MDGKITSLTAIGSIDRTTDVVEIVDVSGNASFKVTVNNLVGISGGAVLSTTDTQTVQNKTLDNTNTLTAKDTLFTLQDDGDVTKQARFQLSGITTGNTRVYTFPDASTTLVGTGTTQTLTGKTLTNPVLTLPTIADFSNAQHDHSSPSQGGTISGGGGGGGATLKVNGIDNTSQAILDLTDGGGIAIVDTAVDGVVTISNTGVTLLQTDNMANGDQSTLNLKSGTDIQVSDNGTGSVTITNIANPPVYQMRSHVETASSTGTTTMPADNTTPTSSEGDPYLTINVTPVSATSIFRCEVVAILSTTAATDQIVGGIFSGFSFALAATAVSTSAANEVITMSMVAYIASSSTSPRTFTFRAGTNNSGTIRFNGRSGAALFGGVAGSYITVTEYNGDIASQI